VDIQDAARHDIPPDRYVAFAQLSRIMLTTQSVDSTLRRIAELARDTVSGAVDVSVTLLEAGRPATVVFTGELATYLDERQYEAGFGPCVEAALTGATITIPDTSDGAVHSDFARAAFRHGVTHVVSVGLTVERRCIGALNVYGAGGGGFDDEAVGVATAFAGYAAIAAANANIHASTATLARNLERALDSRAIIDQAKGVLMARHGLTPAAAFDLLSEQSQHSNRKLRELAEEVVAGTQHPTQGDL
jgi:GAF domain-containing protein